MLGSCVRTQRTCCVRIKLGCCSATQHSPEIRLFGGLENGLDMPCRPYYTHRMENDVFEIPGLRERLKALRLKSGLTQEQVAERMGITSKGARSAISVLEHASTPNPTLRVLCAFLRAVGARWTDIIDLLDRLEPLPEVSSGLLAGAKEVLPNLPARQYQPAADSSQLTASEEPNPGSSSPLPEGAPTG